MLIKRTAPILVCQSGQTEDRALAAYYRTYRNPQRTGDGLPYQSQWLCWEVCSNFAIWRTLKKSYGSLAASQMRYSKESGWPVLPRCCCVSNGDGWRGLGESVREDMVTEVSIPSRLHCITTPSSLHVSGSKWQNVCCPRGTYFNSDFQKQKELKQHHACKTDKSPQVPVSAPSKGANTDLNGWIFSCLTTVTVMFWVCRCSRKQLTI